MSKQHCENYTVWHQTGNSSILPMKCWPLLHVIRGGLMLLLESQRVFSNLYLFVLLYNKSLNDWSLEEQWICFPWDQSLSVHCCKIRLIIVDSTIINRKMHHLRLIIVHSTIINRKRCNLRLIIVDSTIINRNTHNYFKIIGDAFTINNRKISPFTINKSNVCNLRLINMKISLQK